MENIRARKIAAIQAIKEQQAKLLELVEQIYRSNDTTTGWEILVRWKERATKKISEAVSPAEAKKFAAKRKMSFRMGDAIGNFVDEAHMYESFLVALLNDLEANAEDILDRPTPVSVEAPTQIGTLPPAGQSVFIVHGHDELNLLRLEKLLRDRYSLEPIILSGEAGKGRSIIEKFEDEAQRAAYAFVLLTPDDLISKDGAEYAQARPNVIFELGWFYGRLGRNRVCILYKKGTKLHSDLDGISRIQFSETVVEKVDELERELVAVGLLNKS